VLCEFVVLVFSIKLMVDVVQIKLMRDLFQIQCPKTPIIGFVLFSFRVAVTSRYVYRGVTEVRSE